MATNTLLTITMITREALRVLENSCTAIRTVNRNYDEKFAVEGAKIGTTLNIRKPPRYVGTTGQALNVEGAVETSVAVALTKQFGVHIQFSSQDLLLSIDDFSDRFLVPAIAAIANEMDADVLALYDQVHDYVGTPGTTPNALLTYLQAGARLNNNSAPLDGMRHCVVTPTMEITLVDALKGLFQQASAIAEQYVKGQMGRAAGFTFYMDQNCATHTVGALGGTPLVNGANQTGASITTDGWSNNITGVVKKGDILTFASTNQVNVQSRNNIGSLQQFVVTEDADSNGSGQATIKIDPPITVSGAQQTVNQSPADNAVILIFGSASAHAAVATPQGLAYHRDAFVLVTADLPLPRGVDMAARASDKQAGLSMRIVRDYNISTDNFPCRIEVLYGTKAIRPELACRVVG